MNIKLEEITNNHIKWFHQTNAKEEIKKYINNAPSNWSIDKTMDWFYEYNNKRTFNKNDLEYIFIASENGNNIGYTQLFHHDILNNRAEIGIVIDLDFQRKGYGKDILKKTIEIAQDKLGINRLYSTIREDNNTSLLFFKKLGFTEDGLLKDYMYDGNKYWSFKLLSYAKI